MSARRGRLVFLDVKRLVQLLGSDDPLFFEQFPNHFRHGQSSPVIGLHYGSFRRYQSNKYHNHHDYHGNDKIYQVNHFFHAVRGFGLIIIG